MKKCKMTISGKHYWEDYKYIVIGTSEYPEKDENGNYKTRGVYKGSSGSYVFSDVYAQKCLACSMIDDRPKKKI